MTIIHQVSPCCGASIRRFGGRRRQCGACKRTWRRYPHRRGRNPRRKQIRLLREAVLYAQPLRQQARLQSALTVSGVRDRFRNTLRVFTKHPRAFSALRGSYVLIADGVWYTFQNEKWVLYLLLLKPCRRNYALLLDPVLLKGRETFQNWNAALLSIPESVRNRILALVSDHFRASEKISRRFGWIHQLCHFHLIAELERRRGKFKTRLAGVSIRETIYQCVVRLLTREDRHLEQRLRKLILHPDCPRAVGRIAGEFLRARSQYRSYLHYPDLTLPKTTGVAESLAKLIRKRTWPLRTPVSVLQWTTAFIRLKKNMTCNGTNTTLKNSTKLTD